MTDHELIAAVEELTIEVRTFGHEQHVRLAFAYLNRFDLVESLDKVRGGLRRLANHAGAPGKYHETVTCALVVLIHERMADGQRCPESNPPPSMDWDTFAAANPDLLRWQDGAFFDYYPSSILDSDTARETFVLPRPWAGDELSRTRAVAAAGAHPGVHPLEPHR